MERLGRTTPIVERAQGMRLDTNYYYWPGSWVLDRPGMFTGSGFPMRFADTDGTLIDVYQAATQLTDEWAGRRPSRPASHSTSRRCSTAPSGREGFYGVFTANMHTDQRRAIPGAQAIVAAAKARGVPVVSAAQMLDWLDGRNGSSFQDLGFSGGQLRFRVAPAGGANGLEAMVPAGAATGALTSLTRDGVAVSRDDAARSRASSTPSFPAAAGAYVATYADAAESPVRAARARVRAPPRVRVRGPGQARGARQSHAPPRPRLGRGDRAAPGALRPAQRERCRVDVRLRRAGRPIAQKSLTLVGGRTTKVKLRLSRRARTQLARAGSLQVKAVLRLTNGEAATVSTTRVRLLAPRT